MANVSMLLWSDSLLRIQLTNFLKIFKKWPQRILGDLFMIIIIYFYNINNYYFIYLFIYLFIYFCLL